MKPQHSMFKLAGTAFLFVVLMSFMFFLPSVMAQDGDPSTPTPVEPLATPEPFDVPELEQEVGAQILSQPQSSLESGESFPAQANISNTTGESLKPKIAADQDGNRHVVWRELISGKQEIFYTQIVGSTQTTPVNVSNSLALNSDSPQIVVDSTGVAHIVWQEQDNDHGDDYETYYSKCERIGDEETGYTAVCTSPATLSDGLACSAYTGDWKAVEPLIGIDTNDNLMATWMSYEPNPRIYIMYSRWSAAGSPPSNRTGCHISSGLYYYPSLTGDSNGNFHLVMINPDYSVFYSKFSGSWSSAQNIGTGLIPVVHADQNNKIHAAWWDLNTPPKYRSKEAGSTTWSAVENIFSSTRCSELSLITDSDDLPRLACATSGTVYEASRQASGWVESILVPSLADQPDLAKDASGGLHFVWSDFRSGSWDISYSSSTYSCLGTPLSPIAQAVKAKVPADQTEICGNKYESLIILPPGQDAFERFGDLAATAEYEVDFVTMGWDSYESDRGDSPGRIFLNGIKILYDRVKDNPGTHPVKVRILLGLKYYVFTEYQDQRVKVMNDLHDMGIETEETNWSVEVAVYHKADQSFPPASESWSKHSHAKMLIVDGKHMITGGYNMHYNYLENVPEEDIFPVHDMGMQVSGPIAYRALKEFDKLWAEAYLCDDFYANFCWGASTTGPLSSITHDNAISILASEGNINAFSLFRDDTDKTADNAIEAAINAAENEVNIIQNRFMNYDFYNPPQYASAVLNALQKGEGQVRVKLLVSGVGEDLIVNTIGVCHLKDQLIYRDPIGTHHFEAKFSSESNPIHTKALSIDGTFIIVGSQNFDSSAWGEDQGEDIFGDLAEYSLGVSSIAAANDFNSTFEDEFDPANGAYDISCPYNMFSQPLLQDAIDQALPGSVVFIPGGVYTSPVEINKPLILIGAGPNQTAIHPDGNEPAIRITSSDVVVSNMKISGGSGYGIELIDSSPSSLKNIQINRVVFENNAQGGVLVQGLIPGSPMNYTIENNTFIGGTAGITINMLETQADTSLIRNNIFSGQSVVPIHILSLDDSRVEYSYNLFDECDAETCDANWHVGDISTVSSEHDNFLGVDPMFVDAAMGVYQLSTGSPAIDAGDPSLLHDLFYDGDSDGTIQIDIGAFEYVPVEENAAPVVNAGDDQAVDLEDNVVVNATYTDADNSENHSARIDWGDGTVEDVPVNMTGPGTGEVAGQHSYTTPGNYPVGICITDLYGGVGCDTLSVEVLSSSTGSAEIKIGETYILPNDDSDNGNLLVAQYVILSQEATLQSLSFYVASAAGNLRLGLYDDLNGNPGTLLAKTDEFTPVVGWNTESVQTPILLPAGTYWLAYLPESHDLHFRNEWRGTGTLRYYSYAYGEMPSTFSSLAESADFQFSFYATFTVAAELGTVYLGEVNVLHGETSGANNTLFAQSIELSHNAVVQSLSFYVTNAVGDLRLAIYDAGPDRPGYLLAQTDEFTPTVGWNTVDIQTPLLLPTGTYWLVFLLESDELVFNYENIPGEYTGRTYGYGYGELPFSFPKHAVAVQYRYSFFATFIEDDSIILPATDILDDFNRAQQGPPPSANWLDIGVGGLKVLSNRVVGTTKYDNIAMWNDSFGPDVEVFVTAGPMHTNPYDYQELVFRWDENTNTGYSIGYDTLGISVWRWDPSSYQRLGAPIAHPIAEDDQIMARMVGSVISVYVNGELLAVRPDATYTNAGSIGLNLYDTATTADDFGGGTLAGSELLMSMAPAASMEMDNSEERDSLEAAAEFIILTDDARADREVDSLFSTATREDQQAYVIFAPPSSSDLETVTSRSMSTAEEVAVEAEGAIKVVFDLTRERVRILKYDSQQGWVQQGRDVRVNFAHQDRIRIKVAADGSVEIYRNGQLLTTRMVAAVSPKTASLSNTPERMEFMTPTVSRRDALSWSKAVYSAVPRGS